MIEKIEEIDMEKFLHFRNGESMAGHIAPSLIILAESCNKLSRQLNELAEVVNKLNSTGDN